MAMQVMEHERFVGRATSRVDGILKVTGQALYAAEYGAGGLLHGVVVSSTVAAGRIRRLGVDRARAMPGVVRIFTHESRGKAAWLDRSWRDDVAPPGKPKRPHKTEHKHNKGQPVALVVADSYEAARDAASLIDIEYDIEPHC